MKPSLMDQIVHAVLYEGYLLYPYRPSSVKNRQRWTFGGLFPEAWCTAHATGDAATMQTECLVLGSAQTTVQITVRFLHILERAVGEVVSTAGTEPTVRLVEALQVGEQLVRARQEATEQTFGGEEIRLADLGERSVPFTIPASRQIEPVPEAGAKGACIVREQRALAGVIEIASSRLSEDLFRLTVRIHNRTPLSDAGGTGRDDAQRQALLSTHTILQLRDGAFVSLTDPPTALQKSAAGCRNIGAWPVLVGLPGATDTLLSSPIILADYPELAPESPGDLFDGTEIDEILTLRILTLTDEEKRELSGGDDRARALLQRTESLDQDQLWKLHGAIRTLRPIAAAVEENWGDSFERKRLDCFPVRGFELRRGDRVRLRPSARADVFDLALVGKTAVIESIEQDLEGRVYFTVSVDDDPGRDFGAVGIPGHRFFFGPEEVEPLGEHDLTS
jgi:hypothetical protein